MPLQKPGLEQNGFVGTSEINARFDVLIGSAFSAMVSQDGLICWLIGDNITGVADGAAISTWPDASGYGNSGSMTGSNRPTLSSSTQVNGHNFVNFAQASSQRFSIDSILSSGNITGTDQPFSMFLVIKFTDFTNSVSMVGIGRSSTATPLHNWNVIASTKLLRSIRRDDANSLVTVDGVAIAEGTGVWLVTDIVYTGTAVRLYDDGAFGKASTAQDVGATTLDVFGLGAAPTNGVWNNPMNGSIAEFLVYNRAITDHSERHAIQDYLADKYAITLTI